MQAYIHGQRSQTFVDEKMQHVCGFVKADCSKFIGVCTTGQACMYPRGHGACEQLARPEYECKGTQRIASGLPAVVLAAAFNEDKLFL